MNAEAALSHLRSLFYAYVSLCIGLALLSLRRDPRDDYGGAVAELNAIEDVADYCTAERWSERWFAASPHCAIHEDIEISQDFTLMRESEATRCVSCEVIRNEVIAISDHASTNGNGSLRVSELLLLFEEPIGQEFMLDLASADIRNKIASDLTSLRDRKKKALYIKDCTVMVTDQGFVGDLRFETQDGQEGVFYPPLVPGKTITLSDVLLYEEPSKTKEMLELEHLRRMPKELLDESIPRARVLMQVNGEEQALMFTVFGLEIEVSLLRTLSGLVLFVFVSFIHAHLEHIVIVFANSKNWETLQSFAWMPLFPNAMYPRLFAATMMILPTLALLAGAFHDWVLTGRVLKPSGLEIIALIFGLGAGVVGAHMFVLINRLRAVKPPADEGEVPAPG